LARSNITLTRQLFETELVPSLGRACARGEQVDCERELRRVNAVARAAAEASPDAWWIRTADQFVAFGSAGLMRKGRGEALQLYGHAAKLYSKDMVGQAAELFVRIATSRGAPVVAVYWNARYHVCLDAYFRGKHGAARECFRQLEIAIERMSFLHLRGKIDWVRAQISLAEGNLARASSEFDRAIKFLYEAGDTTQAAAAESLRATLLDQLGAFDQAWEFRVKALETRRLEPRRLHTLFTSAARSCLLQSLPLAAISFQEAAVLNAERWGQPGALVESRLAQAMIYHRVGDSASARRALAAARQHQVAVTDSTARSRFESELTVAEGEVLAATSPSEALAVLSRANATMTSLHLESMRARVERATGIALEQAGRFPEAQDAFVRGVTALEQQTSRLSPSVQMLTLDLGWDMQDRLIARRLADDGESAAFATAEMARARSFRRVSPIPIANLPETSEIPGLLPRGSVLVYFLVQDTQTIRWTFASAGAQVAILKVGRLRLEHMVRRLHRAFGEQHWQTALAEASRPLYDLLLAGDMKVNMGDLLVIVPDAALHEVPFSVLRQPGNGRFLIEDFPIVVAPSLRAFLLASQSAREKFQSLDRALVVSGRTGPAEGQPTLRALPNATLEIERIAASYRQAKILAGSDATSARFLAEAGEFAVVHFAGHAIADRVLPEYSRFFMAPSRSDPSGWLLLRDLEAGSFTRTALVVLGACETGAGRIVRGEGVISLARPFLAKGAAGVVYSLWSVDDSASARLLTGFHSAITAGLEPVVALQRVQRALLASATRPTDLQTWAAFQYAGGIRGDSSK
jgi:CHAT domain-containing protein